MFELTSHQLPTSYLQSEPTMSQIFGEFIEDLQTSHEYLILGFSPSSIPLKQRWRNNGLSADFLADYLTTFFPGGENSINGNPVKSEIKSAVSFVANELLENAMKFSDETSNYPVSIGLYLKSDKLVFMVRNSLVLERVSKFQTFLQELTTSDPNDLYIQLLEQNAEDDTRTESRLGLLTMINDYQAILGWKFETVSTTPQLHTVTTMVQLTV